MRIGLQAKVCVWHIRIHVLHLHSVGKTKVIGDLVILVFVHIWGSCRGVKGLETFRGVLDMMRLYRNLLLI